MISVAFVSHNLILYLEMWDSYNFDLTSYICSYISHNLFEPFSLILFETGLVSVSQTGEEMAMGLRDDDCLSGRRWSSPTAALPVPAVPFVYLCLLFLGPAKINEISESCVCVCAEMFWFGEHFDSCDIPVFSGGFWVLGRTRLGLWIGMPGGLHEWQKSFNDDTYEWRIAWERWQGECVMKCFSWCEWG